MSVYHKNRSEAKTIYYWDDLEEDLAEVEKEAPIVDDLEDAFERRKTAVRRKNPKCRERNWR